MLLLVFTAFPHAPHPPRVSALMFRARLATRPSPGFLWRAGFLLVMRVLAQNDAPSGSQSDFDEARAIQISPFPRIDQPLLSARPCPDCLIRSNRDSVSRL